MKLTNEQLAGMYGAYIGCDYQLEYDSVSTGDHIVKYVSFSIFDLYMRHPDKFTPDGTKLTLLLTPLSEITDEDAIEVAKMQDLGKVYKRGKAEYKITEYRPIKGRVKTYPDTGGSSRVTGVERFSDGIYFGYDPLADFRDGFDIKEIDYLRSRGYDCGYMSIPSLIEAGYAIKKEKDGE